jgi:hypothetical protein
MHRGELGGDHGDRMPIRSGIGTGVMTNSSAAAGFIYDDAIFAEFLSDLISEIAGDPIGSTSGSPRTNDLQVFGWKFVWGLLRWRIDIAAGS